MTTYGEAHKAALAAQYSIPLTRQTLTQEEQERADKQAQLWTCKRCSQLAGEYQYGWIIRRDDRGDCQWEPGPNGRPRQIMDPCPVCSPAALQNIARRARQRKLDAAFGGSNIPAKYAGWTFDSYPYTGDQQAKKVMQEFALGQLRGRNCVYLTGSKGFGKTGLSVAVAHFLMERDEQVLYMRSSDYFERVRKQKYNKLLNGQDVDIMSLSYTVRLFILDDLGVERPTYEVATNFYNLIEERRNNPALLTIVSSNRAIEALKTAFMLPEENEENQPFSKVAERIQEDFRVVTMEGQKQRGVRQ